MNESKCELCGEPMPPGEEMFKFHGYSGPCPRPPLPTPGEPKKCEAVMREIIRSDRGRIGFKVDLPPPGARPNKDTVACVCRWNLRLPQESPAWSRYTLLVASLADFPGVPPATKSFPEATHEVVVAAIDPAFAEDAFEKGGVQLLLPINYAEQFVAKDDDEAGAVARMLVEQLVAGSISAEPQGIHGAREGFREKIAAVVAALRAAQRRTTDAK